MAVTGTGYNPGATGANWVAKVYSKQIDRLAYEKSVLWNKVDEKEALKGGLYIPKHDNLTVSTVSDSTDMYDPTLASNTESNVPLTPATVTVAVSVNWNMLERMVVDPTDTLRTSIEMAIGQKVDVDIAGKFSGFTLTATGDYTTSFDLSRVLAARALVKANAKEFAQPGKYILAYHSVQDAAVMGIGSFTQAYARGDKENPQVGGVITEAYGIQFVPTSVITDTGTGFNNALFVGRAIAIAFNQRPTIKLQERGYANLLLGWADYGVNTVRSNYGVLVKSKNTA